MKTRKRIEIVVDHLHTRRVLRTLDQFGVDGYSVISNVRGRGERGTQHADGLTDSSSNDLIIIALPPDRLDGLCDQIRPLLRKFGGICLISDAQWLDH